MLIKLIILSDNYDAIKNEIIKIQQTNSNKPFDPFSPGPTVSSSKPDSNPDNNAKLDWSSAFDQNSEMNSGFGVDNDPFVSFEAKKNEKTDLFNNFPTQNTNTNYDDAWSSGSKAQTNLDSVFMNMPKSTSTNTGFGLDDNWATNLSNKTSPTKTTEWTAFADGNQFLTKYSLNIYLNLLIDSSKSSIKNTINFFNENLKMASPSIPSHSAAKPNATVLKSTTVNWVKFKALYTFEACRDDELTITEGDVINVC